MLEIEQVGISAARISYILDGKTISYPLSENPRSDEILTLSDTRPLKNPVKISGTLQAVGNAQSESERQNISQLETIIPRSQIRKNIALRLRSHTSGTTVQ
jgi:hypothetical protein